MPEIGNKYRRLTLVSRSTGGAGVFLCDCGATVVRKIDAVAYGKTGSCGCLKRDVMVERNTTHGLSSSREYKIWSSMIQRCTNPKTNSYKYYGALGVTVCERWRNSFAAFLADMGSAPSLRHSLDRERNEEGYTPENCRWSTDLEQAANKRNNLNVTFEGRTQNLKAWAREISLNYLTLYTRYQSGWSPERMLTTPVRTKAPA